MYSSSLTQMAPEILVNAKYGKAVDWWSFGVIIYVMLTGSYPFNSGRSKEALIAQINIRGPAYPPVIGPITRSLLQAVRLTNLVTQQNPFTSFGCW
jgi:serine/threonine protein kinase